MMNDGGSDRRQYVLTANIALWAITVPFVLCRVFVRVFMIQAFGADDIFILIAMGLATAISTLILIQTRYGLGRDMSDVVAHNPADLTVFFKYMYAIMIPYQALSFFLKNSFVLFYRRFSVERNYRIAVWTVFCLNGMIWIGTGLPIAFSCNPIPRFWDPTIQGSCLKQGLLYKITSAVNIVMDFLILALPIRTVWTTQMALKRRLVIIGMFAIGGFVCIASVIRITKLFGPSSAKNLTMAAVDSHTWSMIETYLAIIVGCIPTLRPMFKYFQDATIYRYGTGSNGQTLTHDYGSKSGFGRSALSRKDVWSKYNQTELGAVTVTTTAKAGSIVASSTSEEELVRNDGIRELRDGIWKSTKVDVTSMSGVDIDERPGSEKRS